MKNHGKRKRLDGGGGTSTGSTRSDDPPELEDQSAGNQQIRSSTATEGEAARSIYFAVNVLVDFRPVCSLYKVDYPYTSCSPMTPRRLRPVATLEANGSMTYVSVETRRRRWIVAVSGRHTTVFDAETEGLIHGPNLLNEKGCPVLVSVDDKIYALSSCPRVKGEQDLEPWFEVLDMSRARVVDGRLEGCSWEEQPSPPCFPSQLPPHELKYPPMVTVHSYVLVGSYILMSLRLSNRHATYAFHTVSAKWQKVDDLKSLPFIGRATLHDAAAEVYLGESARDNRWWTRAGQEQPAVLTAYHIKLLPASLPSNDDNPAMKLSITAFPVKSSETTPGNPVAGIYCSSLHNGSFCSLNWRSSKRIVPSWDDDVIADDIYLPKKAYITLKTYQMEENSVLQEDRTEPTHKIAIPEQPEQDFKIRTKSGGFVYPDFLTVL